MKKLFLLLVLALPSFLFSSPKTEKVHLHWIPLQSQTTYGNRLISWLSFDSAVFMPEYGSLPLYAMPVNNYDKNKFSFRLRELKADTLETAIADLLSDADLLSGDFAVKTLWQGTGGVLYVLPLKTVNGKIVRLTDFEITVNGIRQTPDNSDGKIMRTYTDTSVLATGRWFKLGIVETGIYRIDYDDFKRMGWEMATVNPDHIKLYGNYTGMLSEDNKKTRPDDLRENAIWVTGAADGSFDPGDAVIFYARGPVFWSYNPFTGRYDGRVNIYTDTTWYFLTVSDGEGKRIQTFEPLSATPSETVTQFYDYALHEQDIVNLLGSGKEWFGEELSGDTMQRTFGFRFPGLVKNKAVFLRFDMAARSSQNTYYKVFANDRLVIDSTRFNKITPQTSVYARESNRSVTFFTDSDSIEFTVHYYAEEANSVAWVNYLLINVVRQLRFQGGQMRFADPHVAATGNIVRYKMANASDAVTVWDVTQFDEAKNIDYTLNGDTLEFTVPNDSIREFFAFDGSLWKHPAAVREVENQNLHGIARVDMVIIAPPQFKEHAQRLAQLHNSYDQMLTVVVEPEQIYNEFSSGAQDVTAIRDFMKMLYDKAAFDGKPGYLLLFGDASFDYRNRIPNNTNLVPTYESDESLRETGSFVTDDYFGLLDNTDMGVNGNLNIGIGRFPVSTTEQARQAVDKVEHYMKPSREVMRDWRNTICFVADDRDQNLHLHQAEQLFSIVDTAYPYLNVNKIYSDAFTKVKVPGGYRFPEVNERINEQVEKGTLIMNYTGHGGLIGWSDEVILDVPAIRSYDNFDNLPLFITATCEFSRFDNPEFISAGEYTFLNNHGGAVALLTTTRLAYAHANIVINMRIYHHLTEREYGTVSRLGDMIRLSKIPSSVNFLNFTLLGDPALRLAIPENNVVTTAINAIPVNSGTDTVHALSKVTVEGEIHDENGLKVSGFNGYVYPKVFDKPVKYTTLGNDGSSFPEDFYVQDKILFQGITSVTDGHFSFSFVVPKDISYHYGFGKISYYALDTIMMIDAKGEYRELMIGGMEDGFIPDDNGPQIALYLDSRHFKSGGITSANPMLIADIFDEQGINTTGHSLGRDMVFWLDNDKSTQITVNDYFVPALDSYQQGTVNYPLHDLEEGLHTLTFRAWDVQNNSSEQTVEFEVTKSGALQLTEVKNYPNPFVNQTFFTFSHNKPGQEMRYEIRIFTMRGRLVKMLSGEVTGVGTHMEPVPWDGRDDNGNQVDRGFYIYRLTVWDGNGNRVERSRKLIRINQ